MNKNILQNPMIKGAIIVLITSILSLTTNYPETSIAWAVFGWSTLGTLILYFGQSIALPGTSATGEINGKDLLKALLVALGNAISTWAANVAEGQPINIKALILTMVGLGATYILKQWQTPQPKG